MRPDALWVPESEKSGSRIFDRVGSVSRTAERLLEVDRAKGERAYIRKQPHGRLFITRDPTDTIFFPTGHLRSGQPRYRWTRRADEIEVGHLVESANG
jgi:hypothetical protein